MTIGELLVIVGVVALVVPALHRYRSFANGERRREFDDALMKHVETMRVGTEVFDPATAALVREIDLAKSRDRRSEQTHRIYRTPSRQYFLFICTRGQTGYLAPLTDVQARNALRSDPAIYAREFVSDGQSGPDRAGA